MQGPDTDTSQAPDIGPSNSSTDPNVSSNLSAAGTAQMPMMPDLMNIGRGGFGMSSETWGQVAARAAMLAAQLREMEVANSQQSSAGGLGRQQTDEGTSNQAQGNAGMWMTSTAVPPFGPGQDQRGGLPMSVFGPPGMIVPDYRLQPQMAGMAGAGGPISQEDLLRSLQGLPPGALIAAGIPLMDGPGALRRGGKAGVAAETRRQNDKEKKRRKRERIGELVKAVRARAPAPLPLHPSTPNTETCSRLAVRPPVLEALL